MCTTHSRISLSLTLSIISSTIFVFIVLKVLCSVTKMAARSVYITNEIIITAMDRFVWFVLLVVMTHLVTEFTRVTGYARGQRHELILLNETMLQPMPVQNMLLYPGYEQAHYEHPVPVSSNSIQQNAAMMLGSLGGGAAGNMAAGNNAAEPSHPFFSLRPLIDSIFEIPISTLRAVNSMVGRLTGSYRQSPEVVQKSVTIEAETPLRLPTVPNNLKLSTTGMTQRQQMREELA